MIAAFDEMLSLFQHVPRRLTWMYVLRVMRNGIQGKPDGRLISRLGFSVTDLPCCCSHARRFQIQHLYCQLSMLIYAVRWPFGLSVSETKNVNASFDATHTPMQWLEYCVLASFRFGGRSCPIGCIDYMSRSRV